MKNSVLGTTGGLQHLRNKIIDWVQKNFKEATKQAPGKSEGRGA